jgi:hypothetical protein
MEIKNPPEGHRPSAHQAAEPQRFRPQINGTIRQKPSYKQASPQKSSMPEVMP